MGDYEALLQSDNVRKIMVFLDNLIEYGRDRYGPRITPLFAQQLDITTRRIPQPDADLHVSRKGSHGDHYDGCNFHWDAALIRLLDALTSISSDNRYRRAADEYIGFALDHCQMEYDGRKYMAAGDHSCYLLSSDEVLASYHELRNVRLPWERMYEINRVMTENEIERLYDHILDPSTSYSYNRHVPRDRPLSLPSSGGTYIVAWAFLFRRSGNPKYYEWAKNMADFFWTSRSPETGIPPTWGEGRGHRTGGLEPFRSFCANLLYAFEELGPEKGGLFRDQCVAYLHSYQKYFRTEAGFCAELDTDTGQRFGEDPFVDHVWNNERLLQLTTTVTYCAMKTKDPKVISLAEILIGDLAECVPERFIDGPPSGIGCLAWHIALPIQACLCMYRLTGDQRYLKTARPWVEAAMSRFYSNDFFVGAADGRIYHNRAGSGYLALTVLRYELLVNGYSDFVQDDVVMQN